MTDLFNHNMYMSKKKKNYSEFCAFMLMLMELVLGGTDKDEIKSCIPISFKDCLKNSAVQRFWWLGVVVEARMWYTMAKR